jgi:hypothetical protein
LAGLPGQGQNKIQPDCFWRKATVPAPMLHGKGLEQGCSSASLSTALRHFNFWLGPKYH